MSGIPAGAGSLLGKRLGKYEILALLALGGTAEIYLARIGGAAGFEKYVVVKCLHDHLADDQEFVKMFLDEARLAAHLDHSNIVQTMELGEHENRYYMVMEFLAGLSLAMVVRRAGERLPGGRIPVPLILNMMAQACAGLHYAHERAINGKVLNIVHRDISPQNLVVSFEGVVKVVDFGIAKAELRETKTRTGTIKGKFAYMSPEQCVAANVDRRTDVFALGVIAHELLTGRRLFKRPSPYETYQAVIDCQVDPPSKQNVELDPALDELIMKSVAKDKDDRYPTAEAFGDALLGYLHHRGKGSGPGDVSRFFDASFAQEIEEHGARMRELISGRDFSVDTGVQWSAEEEEAKRQQTVDIHRGKKGGDEESISLATGDMLIDRPSSHSLSDAIAGLGDEGGNNTSDDDEIPADKTRIESNPLDRVKEMEANRPPDKAAPRPQPAHATSPQTSPTVALKGPGKQIMPPSGPLPLPAPPSGPVAAPAPGPTRPSTPPAGFPNFSHLPTMIADPEPVTVDQPADIAQARTELGGRIVDPNHGAPNGVSPMANKATMQRNAVQPPPQTQPPTGYPVMNAEMSANIARGADIFPSQPPSRGSGGMPQQAPTQPPPYGQPMNAPGQHQPLRPSAQPMYQPQQQQAYPPPQQQQPQHPHDGSGQHAAQLMSPVGQHYAQQVNWEQAAAMPARALPKWMLAALFVGAIVAALILTVVIAKIAT
jgi:serine/threonine-protein kinase